MRDKLYKLPNSLGYLSSLLNSLLLLCCFVGPQYVCIDYYVVVVGPQYVCMDPVSTESIYAVLERRLWDDPNKQVRLEMAKALAALELFPIACERIEL